MSVVGWGWSLQQKSLKNILDNFEKKKCLLKETSSLIASDTENLIKIW